MTMRCEEISEALAAFALDALDNEDRLAVLEHLAECREHDAELQAHRSVADSLPLTLEENEPPARLRTSLLREFDREVAGSASPTQSARPRCSSIVDAFRSPLAGYGIAALLLVALLAVAGLSLLGGGDGNERVVTATTEDGLRLRLVYLPDEEVAVLDVDLPDAPAGQVYQAWQVRDGQTVSLGLLSANHGSTAFAANLDGASAVAVSVEPPGGSAAPTTEPIIVSEF